MRPFGVSIALPDTKRERDAPLQRCNLCLEFLDRTRGGCAVEDLLFRLFDLILRCLVKVFNVFLVEIVLSRQSFWIETRLLTTLQYFKLAPIALKPIQSAFERLIDRFRG